MKALFGILFLCLTVLHFLSAFAAASSNDISRCAPYEIISPGNVSERVCGRFEISAKSPRITLTLTDQVYTCACRPGLVRDPDGYCVPLSECTIEVGRDFQCQGQNEQLVEDRSADDVESSSDGICNYLDLSRFYVPKLRKEGKIFRCKCATYFARHETNGTCLSYDQCNRQLAKPACDGTAYPEIGGVCEPVCDKPKETFCGIDKIGAGIMRCVCDRDNGFSRHSNGGCISTYECVPVISMCGEDEYPVCSNDCESVCDKYGRQPYCAGYRNTSMAQIRCFCKAGAPYHLSRKSDGKCVSTYGCAPAITTTRTPIDTTTMNSNTAPTTKVECNEEVKEITPEQANLACREYEYAVYGSEREPVCDAYGRAHCGVAYRTPNGGGGLMRCFCQSSLPHGLTRHSNGSCVGFFACLAARSSASRTIREAVSNGK